jgi:NADPH:quinone reductase-like Zn-dependent oxidoreductase
MITKIPEHWSMEESVSVLSTYCTVWYGLIDRAQLTRSMNFEIKVN